MTSGTKVLLTLIALFVGVLILYYGFLMPTAGQPGQRPERVVRDPALESPAAPAPGKSPKTVAERLKTPVTAVPERRVAASAPSERLPAARSGAIDTRTARPPAERSIPDVARDAVPDLVMGAATGGGAHRPGAERPGRADRGGDRLARSRGQTPLASDTRSAPDLARPLPAAGKPEPAPSSTARPAYETYTVQEGDTMTSIAARWFGDANKWDLIAKANLVDPNRLKIGQVLRLPPKHARRERPRPAAGRAVEYTVRSGDTLSSIAVAHYGDPASWERIHAANRATIGSEPNDLRVGMKLTIPPASR